MIRSDNAPLTLVEVTGVAGSGKSTATSILTGGSFSRADFISARDLKQLPLFLRSLPRLVPLFVENLRRVPRMTWADFKLMVFISSWDTYLRGAATEEPLVFDQGPLYALVRLRAKGIGVASTAAFARWWSEMLGKWLDAISLVIWLDADDEVLLSRLNSREQSHDLQGAPVEASREFFGRYRSLFDEIGLEIERRDRPAIHRIDTGQLRADQVAEAITSFMGSQSERAP